jgi:CDP-diacylglycerol--serine O-phosphatidyltransferase
MQSTSQHTNPVLKISLADGVTLANGVCGLLAVATALGGHGLGHGRLLACAGLIVLGAVFDVADGLVARVRGGSGLGEALDSMCDTLTFGVAPASLVIASCSGAWRLAALPVAAVLVVASMLRLARYSTCPPPPGGGFYGLPMPSAAGTVVALSVVHLEPGLLLTGVVATAALMVSEVRYPHPDRRTIPALGAYLVVAAAALAGLLPLWPAALGWLVAIFAIPAIATGAPLRVLEEARRGVLERLERRAPAGIAH